MDVARDRMERAKVYFEAVDTYEIDDIEAAVTNLLNGSDLGHNPSFVPPAPVVAGEARRVMHLRLDRVNRERKLHPQLPPPDVVHTPAERERVKQMVDGLVNKIASEMETEDAALSKRKLTQFAKTNARFAPDMTPAAVRRRLGFTAGDPEGAEDAA